MWFWTQKNYGKPAEPAPVPIDTRVQALAAANRRVSELLQQGVRLNASFLEFRGKYRVVLSVCGQVVKCECDHIDGKAHVQAELDGLLKRGEQWRREFAEALATQATAKKTLPAELVLPTQEKTQ